MSTWMVMVILYLMPDVISEYTTYFQLIPSFQVLSLFTFLRTMDHFYRAAWNAVAV